jgi:[FeFe] hydrogenase H-cluster maturation GTPase HydF
LLQGRENKLHIGIFGRTNSGKSSFINSLTGQDISIVSNIPGTTTDPVKKSIEILGLGNVIIIDTAGIDDYSELGQKRILKTMQILNNIDIAIIIFSENTFDENDQKLLEVFNSKKLPYLIIFNKCDLEGLSPELSEKINLESVINSLIQVKKSLSASKFSLLHGLVEYGDVVLLITPIDSEAPEGRMILPQVNAIRNSIDEGCITIVLKESELELFFKNFNIKPKIAITDSQVFKKVDKIIPKDIMLTGFSILLARQKGDFEEYLKGTPKISELKDGDRILLLESCSHTSSCEDIGRVKIPRWIREFTGKTLEFDVVAGLDNLNNDIESYSLVIQCGACVITRKQLINRLKNAKAANIPITNYGMAIAYLQGVYNRAIQAFI